METNITMHIPNLVFWFLALVTVISLSLCVYMYRWRTVKIGESNALLPEDTQKILKEHIGFSKYLIEHLPKTMNEELDSFLHHVNGLINDKFSHQDDLLNAFKDVIQKRENKINRLEQGYETHLFAKGATQMAEFHDFLLDLRQEQDLTPNDLQNIIRQHEWVLKAIGLKLQSPEIGDDVGKHGRIISETSHAEPTDELEKDMTISRIITPAYLFSGPEQEELVRPSRVVFLKFTQRENES